MRIILTFTFVFCLNISVIGQYDDAGIAIDIMTEHAEMSEFFGNTDSPFQIDQYLLNEETDSLEFYGGTSFMFINAEVIQTCEYRRKGRSCKKRYWRWITNVEGEKFSYVKECNKKGVLKYVYTSFSTTEIKIIGKDSIINRRSDCNVNKKGDTLCMFNNRWIYRNDTLVEYWHDYFIKNLTWEDRKSYSIEKYTYPAQNTTIVEYFNGTYTNKTSRGKKTIVISYNENGQIISRLKTWIGNSNFRSTSEDKYFYEDGKWKKTERWYENKLQEIIIKTPISITKK